MSRKGNPYDNVVVESFYSTLKSELVQDASYDDPEQAHMDIFKYIEIYSTRSASTLLWAGLALFSLKYNILKMFNSVSVFLDLSNCFILIFV